MTRTVLVTGGGTGSGAQLQRRSPETETPFLSPADARNHSKRPRRSWAIMFTP